MSPQAPRGRPERSRCYARFLASFMVSRAALWGKGAGLASEDLPVRSAQLFILRLVILEMSYRFGHLKRMQAY